MLYTRIALQKTWQGLGWQEWLTCTWGKKFIDLNPTSLHILLCRIMKPVAPWPICGGWRLNPVVSGILSSRSPLSHRCLNWRRASSHAFLYGLVPNWRVCTFYISTPREILPQSHFRPNLGTTQVTVWMYLVDKEC